MLKISATLALTLTLSSAVELESDFDSNCNSDISCPEYWQSLYDLNGDGVFDQEDIDSKEPEIDSEVARLHIERELWQTEFNERLEHAESNDEEMEERFEEDDGDQEQGGTVTGEE